MGSIFPKQELQVIGEDGISTNLISLPTGLRLIIGNDMVGGYTFSVSAADQVDPPDNGPQLAVADGQNVRFVGTGGIETTSGTSLVDGSRVIVIDGSNTGSTDIQFASATTPAGPPTTVFNITDGNQVRLVEGDNITLTLANPIPGTFAYTIDAVGTDINLASADDQAGTNQILFNLTAGNLARFYGAGGVQTTFFDLGGGTYAMEIDGSAFMQTFDVASADDATGTNQVSLTMADNDLFRVFGSGGIVASLTDVAGVRVMEIDGSGISGATDWNLASADDQAGTNQILFNITNGDLARFYGVGGVQTTLFDLGGGTYAMEIDGSGAGGANFDVIDDDGGSANIVNGDNIQFIAQGFAYDIVVTELLGNANVTLVPNYLYIIAQNSSPAIVIPAGSLDTPITSFGTIENDQYTTNPATGTFSLTPGGGAISQVDFQIKLRSTTDIVVSGFSQFGVAMRDSVNAVVMAANFTGSYDAIADETTFPGQQTLTLSGRFRESAFVVFSFFNAGGGSPITVSFSGGQPVAPGCRVSIQRVAQ